MNFNKIIITPFILFLYISCSHTPLKKSITEKKAKVVYGNEAKCIEKIKYFKILSRLSQKKYGFNYLTRNSTQSLCTIYYKKTMNFIGKHSGKVGIIFEEGSNNVDKDKAILEGLLKSSKSSAGKKGYIVKRVKLNNKKINNALSSLILKKKVGVIITWGSKKFLSRIEKWQKRLKVPTLYIDKNSKKSKLAFKIFPNRTNYSIELVKSLRKKKIKKIAILTPEIYLDSELLKNIKKNLKKYNVEIVHDVVYDANNYHSMEAACRKIFNIDVSKRRDEFNQILQKERRMAAAQGFKLNKKLVFLKAQTDFDAIFIPDNFKIVNHFAKLFEYFKAPKLPLVGTYEWRSEELLKTKNKYLDGAVFVDFVGDPKDLPIWENKKLGTSSKEKIGIRADYRLMGYYSGLLGRKVLRRTNERKLVRKKLLKIKLKDKFINDMAFRNNQFNWPSYAFEIRENKIELMK